jgi:hypothetical protein
MPQNVPNYPWVQAIGLPRRNWDLERDQREFTDFYLAARDDCLRVVLTTVGDQDLAEDLARPC